RHGRAARFAGSGRCRPAGAGARGRLHRARRTRTAPAPGRAGGRAGAAPRSVDAAAGTGARLEQALRRPRATGAPGRGHGFPGGRKWRHGRGRFALSLPARLPEPLMQCPPSSLDRRRFLAAAGSTLLLPAAASLPAFATGGIPTAATPFALADVHLDAGPFAHSQTLNRRYLAALDIDRLLAPYRIEAGLPSPASKYPNWESMGLD